MAEGRGEGFAGEKDGMRGVEVLVVELDHGVVGDVVGFITIVIAVIIGLVVVVVVLGVVVVVS